MLVEVSGPVDWLPAVVWVPDQAPEAVQEVAFVEFHVKVDALPFNMLAGLAPSTKVGKGRTATLTLAETLPPEPTQVSE